MVVGLDDVFLRELFELVWYDIRTGRHSTIELRMLGWTLMYSQCLTVHCIRFHEPGIHGAFSRYHRREAKFVAARGDALVVKLSDGEFPKKCPSQYYSEHLIFNSKAPEI